MSVDIIIVSRNRYDLCIKQIERVRKYFLNFGLFYL